ncbi:DMT family transporter, partial [Klebsiella pneumoniae]
RFWPTAGMLVGYVVALVLLSHVLKKLPVGPTYAVWAGLGTVGAAVMGVLAYHDKLSPPAWAGVALIVGGVVVLGYFAPHTD